VIDRLPGDLKSQVAAYHVQPFINAVTESTLTHPSEFKLYGYICGFTVIPAIVLREKGVDFEFIYLNIFGKREQKNPEHFARHSWGKVPVIVSAFASNSLSPQASFWPILTCFLGGW
jgi:hypothetical protein